MSVIEASAGADHLLHTEARIIAENDTHAVVAIRIRKSWITRNLRLLSALAELVAPARSRG